MNIFINFLCFIFNKKEVCYDTLEKLTDAKLMCKYKN